MRRQLLVFASALAIAGCSETPRVVPPPAPPPRPVPAPAPAPAPAPSPVPQGPDWRDWPLTPGDWVYRQDGRGSVAFFGVAGGEAELILRCDAGRGRVVLSRKGEGVASVTVRTTSTLRQIAVQPLSGAAPRLAAEPRRIRCSTQWAIVAGDSSSRATACPRWWCPPMPRCCASPRIAADRSAARARRWREERRDDPQAPVRRMPALFAQAGLRHAPARSLGYGRGRESPGRFPALRPRIPESLRKRFYTRLVLRLAVIQIVGVPFEGACFFN